MKSVNQEIRNYGDIMSRYGIIIHSELAHHGILGMKWGIRRYQNADGSLTESGKRRYRKLKGGYRIPKERSDAIAIIKDAREEAQKKNASLSRGFTLNGSSYPIHHFADKNGNIALSYSRVPYHGDIYVKGNGNINDLNLNDLFKKPPKHIDN